jgi:hypothetical protein
MPEMHWYDSVAWRKAKMGGTYVWKNAAWQLVKSIWIWSGGAWVLAYTNLSFTNLYASDSGYDGLNMTWTFTGDPTDVTVDIYADYAGGTNFDKYVVSLIPAEWEAYNVNFEGQVGYINIPNTSVRLRLYQGSSLIATQYAFPPYNF